MAGAGYIGLPTAIMFARSGFDVVCYDVSERRVHDIERGVLPNVDEAELQQLLADPTIRARLRAQQAAESADVFIIAVPTPLKTDRTADLSAITAATTAIAPHVRPGDLVILESTVPPRTTRDVVVPILVKHGRAPIDSVDIVHCPERVLPGNIVYEIVHNDRIVGGTTPQAAERAAGLYRSFVRGQLCLTDDVTAELCKLMENAFRDVNIALANELATVADGLGIDIHEAIRLANMHPRVRFANPGIGVGGHCIPVDPWFIAEADPENTRLIQTARAINDGRPALTAKRIASTVASARDARIVLIGMTFKPNSSDTRGSPALEVAALLRKSGHAITHHDPMLPDHGYSRLADVGAGADCLAILVEHAQVVSELEAADAEIRAAMRNPTILRF